LELPTFHGPQYTGADCAALAARWGLEHTFAPVGRPTGNAVVERFIRTMKEEVVWLRDWNTAAELREATMTQPASGLRRTLGGLHVWGPAVGLVISGEYFGWSYGWGVAGPRTALTSSAPPT
jgi:hypothetical protein